MIGAFGFSEYIYRGGRVKEITVEDLNRKSLLLSTVRDKDGGQKEETRQGIPLISQLN